MTVGVVGAGITGLAATHYLADRGVDVVTFDADTEPGGVIRSDRVDGRVLEYGPQRIRLTPAVAEIVETLGLGDELLEADESLPLYVYAEGALGEVPRSVSAFLRTDLLSWRGKLRVLAEPLTDPAAPSERAADVFRRKFGTEAYRNLVEPLFGGMYGSDPAEMPAEHSLSRLMALEERDGSLLRAAIERLVRDGETPPPASFADGLATLPRALYEAHRPYVHLNAPVESIRAGEDGYLIRAGGRTTEVDDLIVTVPAPAAAALLADLEGANADPLRTLGYNALALVHLRADVDAEGFGYQVRRGEPLETLGVTWNESLFGRDGVYTAFLGGMDDPDVIDRPDEELGGVARREFEAVMGADPSVLSVSKFPRAFPAYDTSWSALDDVDLPDGVVLATNYTGGMGIPSRVREARRLADRFASGV